VGLQIRRCADVHSLLATTHDNTQPGRKMRAIIVIMILLFPGTSYSQNPRRFSCRLFGYMLKSIEEQKDKYKVYLQIRDSVYLDRETGTTYDEYPVKNRSSISDVEMDSLVQYCNYKYIFDDSLFHFSTRNVIVDSLGFFDSQCPRIYGRNHFSFVQNISKGRRTSKVENIIYLTSVRVYRDRFIVAFQSAKSNHEVHFYFQLLRGADPLITDVIRANPLHG
jgi:hypothetical protein